MTVEISPLNVKCNLACGYCYQHSLRSAQTSSGDYDMAVIQATLEKAGEPFVIFGGEPLLLDKHALQELFRFGLEQFEHTTIQTNGTLIDDEHLRMFKQYNVRVGVSIDGPGALNDARWAGNLERTHEMTAKTERAIERLVEQGISTGLIVTLNRKNAAPDRLPALCDWIAGLAHKGIRRVRLHILETDNEHIRRTFGLSHEENLQAILRLRELEAELGRKFFDMFDDMQRMLRGQDHKSSCVWRACDVFDTVAVQNVNPLGLLTNCGRTTQDGADFLKAERHGYARYIALYHTPREHGGCQDCRFFLACKGYCPSTAMDNDWRNRTEYCALLLELYERIEAEMVQAGETPLSHHPDREKIEQRLLAAWAQGHNPTIARLDKAPPDSVAPVRAGRTGWNGSAFAFSRFAWAGAEARRVWKPLIFGIGQAWHVMELASVREGLRACALLTPPAWEMPQLEKRARKYGLDFTILSNPTFPWPGDRPASNAEFVVLGSPAAIAQFHTAWDEAEHDEKPGF